MLALTSGRRQGRGLKGSPQHAKGCSDHLPPRLTLRKVEAVALPQNVHQSVTHKGLHQVGSHVSCCYLNAIGVVRLGLELHEHIGGLQLQGA